MIIRTNTEAYNGTVNFIGANLLELTFDGEVPSVDEFVHFSIVSERGKELPIRGYTDLYKLTENGFILSNDGSFYQEPAYDEPIMDDPVDESVAFTIEERLDVLEGAVMEIAELLYN